MEIFIHLGTNLEYFDLLNEWFLLSLWKKDRDIASFFVSNFPGELAETISPQYEVNFLAIREIKRKFWVDAFNKIWWIYYWSDNCEFLLPTVKEIEAAFTKFLEFNKKYPPHKVRSFTLVTPYIWNGMINRLEETLAYLNSFKTRYDIEVVLNDYWTLNLLTTKYTNLKPIFGRLIHKLMKTPLIDTYGYDVHPAWELIKNKTEQEKTRLKEEIIKWQLKFYSSAEAWLDLYRGFLKRHSINRVALDYMQKREELYDNSRFWDIWIDLYYPWAIIFTWRLCDTSWIENPARAYYAIDEICPRTCNRYDIFYKVKTIWYNMIQRWNAGYRSELNLDYIKEDFIKNPNNRFIFAPFVAV